MSQVSITLVRADTNQEFDVELPDDAAIAELLPALVRELGLPLTGPDGNQVAYELSSKRTGKEFKEKDTLGSGGAKAGDVLLLTSTFVAGAESEVAKPLCASDPLWRPKHPPLAEKCASCPFRVGNNAEFGAMVQRLHTKSTGKPLGPRALTKATGTARIRISMDVDVRGPEFVCHGSAYDADMNVRPLHEHRQCPGAAEYRDTQAAEATSYNRYDPDSKKPEHTPEQAAAKERVRVTFDAWKKANTKIRQLKKPEKLEIARAEAGRLEKAYREASAERDKVFDL